MKKVALLFVLAVILPSLVLAWLAVRSLRDQQFVLERQQSLIYQNVTDSLAKEINDYLDEQQRQFVVQVEKLMAGADARIAAANFDEQIRKSWPLAEVGFCVTLSGSLLCPSPTSREETRLFCEDNSRFLGNREAAEIYSNAKTATQVQQLPLPTQQSQVAQNAASQSSPKFITKGQQVRNVAPKQQLDSPPSKSSAESQQAYSKVTASEGEFRQLVGDERDGMLARFLQNELRLMFWHRLENDPQLVFGAQVDLTNITGIIRRMVQSRSKPNFMFISTKLGRDVNSVHNFSEFDLPLPALPAFPDEICLIVLDDIAKPVAISDWEFEMRSKSSSSVESFDSSFRKKFRTSLKHPFVATEIGESLPHWEVTAYLHNPDSLKQTARTVQLTFGLLILVLVLAISVGSWLIVTDLNRQLKLARQKTDFVSNVSHELKTPLTSIRMFSEMLAEGRVIEPDKQRSFLNIITAETARLTRLINNVLDFSRMERGEKKYSIAPCDLVQLVRETVEAFRPHLESNGFRFTYSLPSVPLMVNCDRDALSQVVTNLLSNAEKYSTEQKEIELQLEQATQPMPIVEVRVLDRGLGVPRGCEEKIFEQFYRAHDSLHSGIQGSGLGLTLARQIARAHGGDVTCKPRDGSGSCFVLRLPLKSP